MARTGNNNQLWKETPATSMTKAQLLALANAKDMGLKELRRKYKARKAALKESQAALVAAQASQAAETATSALIQKPHGTSGRGNFNLANEMGVESTLYHEIQAFVRSLVNMSAIDKTQQWKNQLGDEIRKVFAVAVEKYPVMEKFEYNWATAEMVKLYSRNSRAQAKRKAHITSGPPSNSGPAGIGSDAGASIGLTGMTTGMEENSDSSSDDDSDYN